MSEKTEVELIDHNEGYAQEIRARQHTFWADEPPELDGLDSGPTPMELMLAALGSCTSITMRMYARRKGWPLETLRLKLTHEFPEANQPVTRIVKTITIEGDLSDEQRQRLLEIADRCPVHRVLTGELEIETHAT